VNFSFANKLSSNILQGLNFYKYLGKLSVALVWNENILSSVREINHMKIV